MTGSQQIPGHMSASRCIGLSLNSGQLIRFLLSRNLCFIGCLSSQFEKSTNIGLNPHSSSIS